MGRIDLGTNNGGKKMYILNFVLISLCILMIIYKLGVIVMWLIRCSETVEAVVVDMDLREDIEKETLFSPVYQFTYKDKEYKVENKQLSDMDFKRKMQEPFKLRIDPNDPTRVFDMSTQLKSALFFVVFPVLFIVLIVIFNIIR